MPCQMPKSNPFAFGFPTAPFQETTATARTPKSSSFSKFSPALFPAVGGFQDAAAPSTTSLLGSAPSGFSFGQGFGPFQHKPTSNTTSTASSLFGVTPNVFATTPASTMSGLLGFDQKSQFTPVTKTPTPVNLFAHREDTLPLNLVSSSPKAVTTSMAPPPIASASGKSFPKVGGLTPQASQFSSQIASQPAPRIDFSSSSSSES